MVTQVSELVEKIKRLAEVAKERDLIRMKVRKELSESYDYEEFSKKFKESNENNINIKKVNEHLKNQNSIKVKSHKNMKPACRPKHLKSAWAKFVDPKEPAPYVIYPPKMNSTEEEKPEIWASMPYLFRPYENLDYKGYFVLTFFCFIYSHRFVDESDRVNKGFDKTVAYCNRVFRPVPQGYIVCHEEVEKVGDDLKVKLVEDLNGCYENIEDLINVEMSRQMLEFYLKKEYGIEFATIEMRPSTPKESAVQDANSPSVSKNKMFVPIFDDIIEMLPDNSQYKHPRYIVSFAELIDMKKSLMTYAEQNERLDEDKYQKTLTQAKKRAEKESQLNSGQFNGSDFKKKLEDLQSAVIAHQSKMGQGTSFVYEPNEHKTRDETSRAKTDAIRFAGPIAKFRTIEETNDLTSKKKSDIGEYDHKKRYMARAITNVFFRNSDHLAQNVNPGFSALAERWKLRSMGAPSIVTSKTLIDLSTLDNKAKVPGNPAKVEADPVEGFLQSIKNNVSHS